MKEAVSKKKEAHKAVYQNSTEENKRRYEIVKNKAWKAVSKATKEKAVEALTELKDFPNGMFRLVKGLNTDSKEVEGGGCMRGSDGRQSSCERERGKVWKDYMERIINDENDWDHNVEENAMKGPVVCVG